MGNDKQTPSLGHFFHILVDVDAERLTVKATAAALGYQVVNTPTQYSGKFAVFVVKLDETQTERDTLVQRLDSALSGWDFNVFD